MEPQPSAAKNARPLSPDLHPWEQQPGETPDAYAGFVGYRDSEDRRVGEHGANSRNWSSMWSWGYRAYQWDLHMARVDQEEMVRYRRRMNERQRTAARYAQQQIVQWLQNLNPAKLKPAEAARWWEIAVRVEREAAGAHLDPSKVAEIPDEVPDSPEDLVTLGSLLDGEPVGDQVEADMAEQLHELLQRGHA
jgi:hypothetical protein